MKKFIFGLFLLNFMQLSAFSIPFNIPIKVGYTDSINKNKYKGLELGTSLEVYEITPTLNIIAEPSVYLVDSFRLLDPALMFSLNKQIPLNDKYGLIFSGGIGGVYLSGKEVKRHSGLNFVQKVETGVYRNISEELMVTLKVAGWGIYNMGIKDKDRDPRAKGYKILLGFQKKL